MNWNSLLEDLGILKNKDKSINEDPQQPATGLHTSIPFTPPKSSAADLLYDRPKATSQKRILTQQINSESNKNTQTSAQSGIKLLHESVVSIRKFKDSIYKLHNFILSNFIMPAKKMSVNEDSEIEMTNNLNVLKEIVIDIFKEAQDVKDKTEIYINYASSKDNNDNISDSTETILGEMRAIINYVDSINARLDIIEKIKYRENKFLNTKFEKILELLRGKPDEYPTEHKKSKQRDKGGKGAILLFVDAVIDLTKAVKERWSSNEIQKISEEIINKAKKLGDPQAIDSIIQLRHEVKTEPKQNKGSNNSNSTN